MELIEENELLSDLCKEYSIELPNYLKTRTIYEEIENFKDFEYIYCIAYEMLIRTDEYHSLLGQYDELNKPTNQMPKNEKIAKLDNLISQMNKLGLNQNSFIGFDCGNENVFERIKLYDEIVNSPWSVRTLDKFVLASTLEFEDALQQLVVFYHKKQALYVIEDINAKNKNYVKTNIDSINAYINHRDLFIKTVDKTFKSLGDTLYLKELDPEFLSILKEKKDQSLLKQIKLDYKVTTSFWYKYTLDDVKYGIDSLIAYYISNGKIQRIQNDTQNKITSFEVFYNLSNYLIPGSDRVSTNNKDTMIYISKNMSLKLLEDEFLSTLEFANLKGSYIETDPKFSRPRLMFDEARLINLPVNLNLSKEELLLYISQIKDEYDKDPYIVKDFVENFFDRPIESEYTEMPTNIKHVDGEAETKRLFPNERQKFKTNLASAFYMYDIYKIFLPYFKKKCSEIKSEEDLQISELEKNYKYIKNAHNDRKEQIKLIKQHTQGRLNTFNIITAIQYLFNTFSKEQVEYYLSTMKEFIHGVNLKDEDNVLKKKYNPNRFERPEPKYKNLIIGDSYIITSNKPDLCNTLLD